MSVKHTDKIPSLNPVVSHLNLKTAEEQEEHLWRDMCVFLEMGIILHVLKIIIFFKGER